MNEEREVKVHQGRNISFFRNVKDVRQDDFFERISVSQQFITKNEIYINYQIFK